MTVFDIPLPMKYFKDRPLIINWLLMETHKVIPSTVFSDTFFKANSQKLLTRVRVVSNSERASNGIIINRPDVIKF